MRVWLRAVVATLVVAALAVGVLIGRNVLRERAREQALAQASEQASAFLSSWEEGSYDQLPTYTVGPGDDIAEVHRSTMERLEVQAVDLEQLPAQLRDPEDIEAGIVVSFHSTLELGGIGEWSYDSQLALERVGEDDTWLVDWTPSSLHPDLSADTRLERVREWPERAPILDRDGQPIVDTGTTLGRVVGHVGEVTEEQLAELGAPYEPGQVVGQRGLQRSYEEQLAGSPSGEIRVVQEDGTVVEVLLQVEGRAPRPLQTTLDVSLQRAAEGALGEDMPPSALVLLDAPTGEIRAVVDRPASGFARAFGGQYAPGSTFKVATAAAALRNGVTLDTTVDCPERVRIGGRSFKNFQDSAFGEIPFREAIFRSCNTAFVQVAADLPEGALDDAARDFGFDADYSLPTSPAIASFPQPKDLAERAAASIGQGRVLASPLHMASVAAAIASGRWHAPTLVQEESLGAASKAVDDVNEELTEAMLEVPRQGTAEGAGLPDGVAGKTGTAEFGTAAEGEDLATNAWFIGFADVGGEHLAWAVLVEGGESGGSVAAPVAARLLRSLGP